MKRKQIIVDTSVISLLADKKKTGSGALKQKEFYRSESEGCTWNITNEILKEVKNFLFSATTTLSIRESESSQD